MFPCKYALSSYYTSNIYVCEGTTYKETVIIEMVCHSEEGDKIEQIYIVYILEYNIYYGTCYYHIL